MSVVRFHDGLDMCARSFAEGLIGHVLHSCAPETLMSESVGGLYPKRPTHVLAFGKASMGMAGWCVQQLGNHFVGGVVLAPESLMKPIHPRMVVFPADHPNPTQRNIDATEALREYAEAIPNDHACIVCISGGGSAHLCSPRPGRTLEEIIETTRSMNASGATIGELNRVRREMEVLKGGGLARVLDHVAGRWVFVLSDVIGDDLATIASGPMISEQDQAEHTIIGNHRACMFAAWKFCPAPDVVLSQVTAESQEHGRILADEFIDTPSTIISVGETTVDTMGSVGVGGPCMETALACAQSLYESGIGGWLVIGLATDGIDGPTDAAGAVITPTMIDSDARAALADHDTLRYLDRIGAAFRTGATGTNVNDLVVVTPLPTEIQG